MSREDYAQFLLGFLLNLDCNDFTLCYAMMWYYLLTPHIQHTPSLNCYVWSTLQSTEHQNDQTQKQFLPSSNPSHEHLTLNMEHTTLFTLFIHLLITHTYFFISNLHISDLYTHNCLYYILCFCYFVYCLFVYYCFIICVLSCCCHSAAPWSFCHYNKFLVCVNIPGQ